jgi:hypothetical protein
MSDKDRATFEGIAGDLLRELGYGAERAPDPESEPLS